MLLALAGELDAAQQMLETSRRIAADNGYESVEIAAALHAADIQATRGEYAAAAACMEAVLRQALDAEDQLILLDVHREMSGVYRRLGDFEQALNHYERFHRIERESQTEVAATRARLLTNHFELDNARLEAENARLEAELHQLRTQELEADKRALQRQAIELDRRAHEDELTGLSNRRYVEQRLPRLHRAAVSGEPPLCVAIVDVDHFKSVNDTFGHATGDEVLRRLAAVLRQYSRDVDLVARLGGEEFLLVFPGIGIDEARRTCEWLRAEIAGQPWRSVDPDLRVTASFGLAEAGGTDDYREMLATADARLYDAKRNGRNRVEVG